MVIGRKNGTLIIGKLGIYKLTNHDKRVGLNKGEKENDKYQ